MLKDVLQLCRDTDVTFVLQDVWLFSMSENCLEQSGLIRFWGTSSPVHTLMSVGIAVLVASLDQLCNEVMIAHAFQIGLDLNNVESLWSAATEVVSSEILRN